jgi:hypothetical protein
VAGGGEYEQHSTAQYSTRERAERLVLVAVMLAIVLSAVRAADPPHTARGGAPAALKAAPAISTPVAAPAVAPGVDTPADEPASAENDDPAPAAYASLLPLHNALGCYWIYWPSGWHMYDYSDDRTASIFISRDEQDHSTYLSIDAQDNTLAPEDLDPLSMLQNFANRLQMRPGAQTEWQRQYMLVTTLVLEAAYTYANKNDVGRRWVRVLYTGAKQYTITVEAPSLLDYAAAEPVFVAMMATFRLD